MAKTPDEQKEANRLRAQARAKRGLCCSCNRKAIKGTRRCEVHTQLAAEQAQKRYNQRKTAKICPLCRDPKAEVIEDKTCCQLCLDKQAQATASRREDYKPRMSELKEQYYQERLVAGLCVLCGKRPPDGDRVDCNECNTKNKARAKRRHAKRRLAVITHYGGKCACPGCNQDRPEFLQVDHINNDGAAHRKEIGRGGLYRWLIANNYPPGFQLHCANCNWAKRTGEACPYAGKEHH